MMDENQLKCIQYENIVRWTRKCWMKSLIESKLHPTSSSMIFFFFFIFFNILEALKCIKHFTQHRKFSMLDEMLDVFAPAFTELSSLKYSCCYEVPSDNAQRQFVYFIVAICRDALKSFLSQFLERKAIWNSAQSLLSKTHTKYRKIRYLSLRL